MPYKEEMTWHKHKNRWQKMHRGVLYVITPKKLDADRRLPKVHIYSRDGTRAAANRWWQLKEAELTGETVESALQRIRSIPPEEIDRMADPLASERQNYAERVQQVRASHGDAVADAVLTILGPTAAARRLAANPETAAGALDMVATILEGGRKPVEKARTLKVVADQFLAAARVSGRTGQPVAAVTLVELRDWVGKELLPVFGDDFDVSKLTAASVAKMHAGIAASHWGDGRKEKHWGFFVRFVKWLYTSEILETLPRNLSVLGFRKADVPPVKVYDVAEVRRVVLALTPRLRLYALLALNCGMLSADQGRLTKDMIDLEKGRLVRRRGKTKSHKTVPTVNFKLWPETVELLRQCWSDHPTLVLTTSTGTPLYVQSDTMKSGRKDMLRQQWRRHKVSLDLEVMRKVSPTALKGHPTHGRYYDYFLGHAPVKLSDKHYAGEDAAWQAGFDEAVMWLRDVILGKSN